MEDRAASGLTHVWKARKNNRERRRRQDMNDRLLRLAYLVYGNDVSAVGKVDKTQILDRAISVISEKTESSMSNEIEYLRAENLRLSEELDRLKAMFATSAGLPVGGGAGMGAGVGQGVGGIGVVGSTHPHAQLTGLFPQVPPGLSTMGLPSSPTGAGGGNSGTGPPGSVPIQLMNAQIPPGNMRNGAPSGSTASGSASMIGAGSFLNPGAPNMTMNLRPLNNATPTLTGVGGGSYLPMIGTLPPGSLQYAHTHALPLQSSMMGVHPHPFPISPTAPTAGPIGAVESHSIIKEGPQLKSGNSAFKTVRTQSSE